MSWQGEMLGPMNRGPAENQTVTQSVQASLNELEAKISELLVGDPQNADMQAALAATQACRSHTPGGPMEDLDTHKQRLATAWAGVFGPGPRPPYSWSAIRMEAEHGTTGDDIM